MRRRCFNFEASGHHFKPLDDIAGVVIRLFCSDCGRVVPANEAYNTEMWANVDLPTEIRDEFPSTDGRIH